MHRGNCNLSNDDERKDLKPIIIKTKTTSDTSNSSFQRDESGSARDAELLIAQVASDKSQVTSFKILVTCPLLHVT